MNPELKKIKYYSPEIEFLLLCSRSKIDTDRSTKIKALSKTNIDWDYLISIAQANKMTQLLYWNINSICPEAVPGVFLNYIKEYTHNSAKSNLFLTKELYKLLNLFKANDIQVIPYKGPVLAALIYNNIALREFADLDILIHRNDFPKVKKLLLEKGYCLAFNMTVDQERAYLDYYSEYCFDRDDSAEALRLEIHFDILSKYFSLPMQFSALWDRCEKTSFGNHNILSLSHEDLLIILCVNGAKKCWDTLGSVCDIAELINIRKDINWEQVINTTTASGIRQILFLGLYLANNLLEAKIPEEVLQEIEVAKKIKALAEEVYERLFGPPKKEPGLMKTLLFQLKVRDHLFDKIKHLIRFSITPSIGDWKFFQLPIQLSFIYYFIRPIRLLKKYLHQPFKTKLLSKNIFLKFLSTLISTMPREVSLALILMLCLSFTEGIGLMLLLPILQLVGISTGQDSTSGLISVISSAFKSINLQPTLISVLGIYVLITSINALLNYWQTVINQSVEHKFVVILQNNLYRTIVHSNWLYFTGKRASDFTHVITTELVRVGNGTYYFLALVVNIAISFIYIFLAMQLSVFMTILVFACGTSLLLLLKRKMQQAHLTGEDLSMESKGLYAAAIEHFSSMKTTKSYNAEERNSNIFSQVANEVAQININIVKRQAEIKCWFEIGAVFILSLILYISLKFISISTASLLLLLFLFARIIPRFSSLQQNYQEITHMLPAFANFLEIKDQCEKVAETTSGEIKKIKFYNSMKLEDIFFDYKKQKLFTGLNLTIQAFKTIAIVGPSGSGKSTIADLLMGLIVPDEGCILVDNISLTSNKIQAWREQIGYVSQDTFLFHDTIKANLLWACPNASEEEMKEALKTAQAYDFVSRLPHGMDTVIGDRGVLLSGGERQRIALARALLRKPSLLILDEATSHLDFENEERIQEAIDKLHGNITILLITHRLSTVRRADIICVLEEGKITESGNWNKLTSNKNGRFYKMCQAQEIIFEEDSSLLTHV